MSRLPVISGDKLIKVLTKLGYIIVREKGSHVQLKKETRMGIHHLTVPRHAEIAKGTLNDILSKVSLWNNMSKEELIKLLSKK